MGHRRRRPSWPFVLPVVALLGGFTSADATPGAGGGPPAPFSIGLIGDWGYTPDQRSRLPGLIEHMNAAGLAFSVHDGDIKNGPPPCSDDVYFTTRRLFNTFDHPLVYTPGDNEWTDCWQHPGYDPNERLRFLRPVFFSTPRSLGRRTLPLERQGGGYPENARWHLGGVTFATLHVVGSNNHLPDSDRPGDRAEFAARTAADLVWLRGTFQQAAARHSAGVMLFIQADPLFELPAGKRYGYDEFLRALTDQTIRFRRPVVLVHGDRHTYRLDHPMTTGSPPRPVGNFTRVETHGPRDIKWVRATVDLTRPGVFAFRAEAPGGG